MGAILIGYSHLFSRLQTHSNDDMNEVLVPKDIAKAIKRICHQNSLGMEVEMAAMKTYAPSELKPKDYLLREFKSRYSPETEAPQRG